MGGKTRTCVICYAREKQRGGFFASFPLDVNRCRTWVKVIGNEDLAYLPIEKLHETRYVCGDHFERKDLNKKGNRLKKCAIPKLKLTSTPLTDKQLEEFPLHVASKRDPHSVPSANTGLASTVVNVSLTSSDLGAVPSTSKGLTSTKATTLNEGMDENQDTKRTSMKRKLDYCETDLGAVPSTSKGLTSTLKATTLNEGMDENQDTKRRSMKRKLDYCETDLGAVPSTSKGLTSTKATTLNEGMDENQDTKRTSMKRKLDYCETEMTPRKKKLIMQLQKTKCTITSLRRSANLVENIKSPVLKDIITATIKNEQRKSKGRRWTTKNKISALAIYKRSPKAYRYLCGLMPLPSERTLQNVLKKMPMETGINKQAIEYLKKMAIKQSRQGKLGCLLFDEVKLKPCLILNETTDEVDGYVDFGKEVVTPEETRAETVADHALVFMFQGLYKKFKQPIAYYFVKGTVSSAKLSSLIKLIIKTIKETGFRVVATVCDQGPTNVGAVNLLKSGTPYAETNKFDCCGDKVYIMFDIPHLFKSIRNNFLNQGQIEIDGRKGRWSDICKAEEKNSNLLYLSKITKTHVFPKYKAKMRVKYAAQVLSLTVSAVLKLMSESEKNEERSKELMDTALVVEDLDRLFDYTNGPSGPDDIKLGRRQNVSIKTDHLQVWSDFKKKISTMKFVNKNGEEARNVKCIQGYITSLNSLQDIWQEVRTQGFHYLNLRQLNQDSLENLFGLIRQHSPTNKFPTCASFVAALKTSVISGLTAHSRNSNCQADKQTLLTNFEDIVFGENIEENIGTREESITENMTSQESLHSLAQDIPILSLPEEYIEIETELTEIDQQPLVFISGYVASTFKKHECSDCQNILTIDDPKNTDGVYAYISLREWWKDRKSLTYPSLPLIRTIEKCINAFECEILQANNLHKKNICMMCVTLFNSHCDTTWYTCESHKNDMLQRIFIRLSRLLVRRQCYRINQTFRQQEEAK